MPNEFSDCRLRGKGEIERRKHLVGRIVIVRTMVSTRDTERTAWIIRLVPFSMNPPGIAGPRSHLAAAKQVSGVPVRWNRHRRL